MSARLEILSSRLEINDVGVVGIAFYGREAALLIEVDGAVSLLDAKGHSLDAAILCLAEESAQKRPADAAASIAVPHGNAQFGNAVRYIAEARIRRIEERQPRQADEPVV